MTKKIRKPTDANLKRLSNESVLSEAEMNAVSAGTRKSSGASTSTGGMTFLRFDFA